MNCTALHNRKHVVGFSAIGAVLAAAIVLSMNGSAWAEMQLDKQTSNEGGVVVDVVPQNVAPDAESWDFKIALNTHTKPLSQDLAQVSVLVDAEGKTHAPLSWDGDPPGGHHRKGVLRFRPLPGKQDSLELRISEVGGVPVRVFRWEMH